MEQIHQGIRKAIDTEEMLRNVIDDILAIFDCDRAWLMYPCDPDAPDYRVPVASTKAEYPSVTAHSEDFPSDATTIRLIEEALAGDGPVTQGPGCDRPLPEKDVEDYAVRTQMVMPLYPKMDKPWLLGIHQCSHARIWTDQGVKVLLSSGYSLNGPAQNILDRGCKGFLQKPFDVSVLSEKLRSILEKQ